MTDNKKQENNLLDEKFEIEDKILDDLRTLIAASWDSNTVKFKLENSVKELDKIHEELFKLDS